VTAKLYHARRVLRHQAAFESPAPIGTRSAGPDVMPRGGSWPAASRGDRLNERSDDRC